MWMDQENVGGTTYFYSETAHQQGLQEDPGGPIMYPAYSVYPGTPAHLKEYTNRPAAMPPPHSSMVVPPQQPNSYFVNEDLKLEIMHKNALVLSQANPSVFPDLPANIDHYVEICPLETQVQKSIVFGYPTSTYKAVNSKNGFTYCLKRIHGMLVSMINVYYYHLLLGICSRCCRNHKYFHYHNILPQDLFANTIDI